MCGGAGGIGNNNLTHWHARIYLRKREEEGERDRDREMRGENA